MTSSRAPNKLHLFPGMNPVAAIAVSLLISCIHERPAQPDLVTRLALTNPISMVRDADSSQLTLTAAIHAGSAWDPLGTEGLAYQTAAALFRQDAGPGREDGALAPILGNAAKSVVDREWVTFTVVCSTDTAERCVKEWMGQLREPSLAAHPPDPRGVIPTSSGAEADVSHEALQSWLYRAHPYGHAPWGRPGVQHRITSEAMEDFHRRHYLRSRIWLRAEGAIDDDAVALLSAELEKFPDQPAPASPLPPATHLVPPELVLQSPEPLQGQAATGIEGEFSTVSVAAGHTLDLSVDDPDYVRLWAALAVLSGPANESSPWCPAPPNTGERAASDPPAEMGAGESPNPTVESPPVAFGSSMGRTELVNDSVPARPGEPTRSPDEPLARCVLRLGGSQVDADPQTMPRQQLHFELNVTAASPEATRHALADALARLDRWARAPISEGQWSVTRAALLDRTEQDGDSSDPRGWLARAMSTHDQLPWKELLETTTADDLTQTVSRHIRPDDMHFIAVGSDIAAWMETTFEGNEAAGVEGADSVLENGTGQSHAQRAIPYQPALARIIPLSEFFR